MFEFSSEHLLSRWQLEALQAQLEAVTMQSFRCTIEENSARTFFCHWRNEFHIDYALHLSRMQHDRYRLALAVFRYKEASTNYDASLDRLSLMRLLNEPRRCIALMMGLP